MVVDDRPINRQIIARLAADVERDLEVVAFANPLDALAHAADEVPDLLITDFKMEPIDGDEFIRRFRCVPACNEVPVIIVTAFQEPELRDRAIQVGTVDFILSPFDHREFTIRSRRALALSRLRKLSVRSVEYIGDWTEPCLVDKAAADAGLEMVRDMMKTINNQLVATLAELESTKDDLKNLLDASDMAAIFIDADLRVRRFTPFATSVYRLRGADIGQPLTAIPTNLAYNNLERDFREAVSLRKIVEAYLPTKGADHYLMRLLPSYRKDGSVDGAIVTFTKIGA